MSTFNLSKKLQPDKRAWKSFKNHLQSKLHNSKLVKAITTLRQQSRIAWRSIFPFIHQKFLAITKRAPSHSRRRRHHHQSYSAIYIDDLFPGPVMLRKNKDITSMAESSGDDHTSIDKSRPGSIVEADNGGKIQIQQTAEAPGKGLAVEKGKEKAKAGESSSKRSDKWKVPLLPQFRGIDERAEEFIAKFRNDMKLEREQSILEFEEMLKRSA